MTHNIPPLSQEDTFMQQLTQTARAIQPNADFAAALEQRLSQTPSARRTSQPLFRMLRAAASLAVALSLLAALMIYVPPLRAIAQEIFRYFIRTTSDQRTFTLAPYPPTETQFFKSVQETEIAFGRDFVEPQALPSQRTPTDEISVTINSVSASHGGLLIEYQPLVTLLNASGQIKGYRSFPYASLFIWFSQAPKHPTSDEPYPIGKNAYIETVTLQFRGHPVSAQFLRGIWTGGQVSQEELEAAKNGTPVQHDSVWVDDGTIQLFWEDETTFYSLQFFKQDILPLTRDDLIHMAESIQ